jgi:transcriptional regulator GlxA family with amidase domain
MTDTHPASEAWRTVSARTLIRRFRSALDQTPLNYLQDLRPESARALLETSALGIEKIANQAGYGDTSSFTRLFRQRIGVRARRQSRQGSW